MVAADSHFGRDPAEVFWERIRSSSVHIEPVTPVDLEAAWSIGSSFPKRDFSLIDRTSLAVMQRLGTVAVATFDDAFAAFRYGRRHDKALEIIRSGHSAAFKLLSEAIVNKQTWPRASQCNPVAKFIRRLVRSAVAKVG